MKIINIEKFFLKSSCCIEKEKQSNPSRNSAPFDRAVKYFEMGWPYCHAATITIGNKYYGGMNISEQYSSMVKTIKQTYPYHGDIKYLFCFEQQNNGNLHAHGILYGGSQGKFIDAFHKFGSRNTHDKSYEDCRNKGYIEYITKDVHLMRKQPPLTNVKTCDIDMAQTLFSNLAEIQLNL